MKRQPHCPLKTITGRFSEPKGDQEAPGGGDVDNILPDLVVMPGLRLQGLMICPEKREDSPPALFYPSMVKQWGDYCPGGSRSDDWHSFTTCYIRMRLHRWHSIHSEPVTTRRIYVSQNVAANQNKYEQ